MQVTYIRPEFNDLPNVAENKAASQHDGRLTRLYFQAQAEAAQNSTLPSQLLEKRKHYPFFLLHPLKLITKKIAHCMYGKNCRFHHQTRQKTKYIL